MDFWKKAFDVTKNVGTIIANDIEETANSSKELRAKYDNLSDSELIQIVKRDGILGKTKQERSTAYSILIKRGYTPEKIQNS